MSARAARLAALAVWAGAALSPGRAHAYTIESAIAPGCHERISSDALRQVRLELDAAAPLAASRDERALIGDLQFTPAADMLDLGGASLLIGVRDNDLKGRSSMDLTQLAQVHGNPDAQLEHCLRGEGEIEPEGTDEALEGCRTFIRERSLAALEGLGAGGAPDPAVRVVLPLHLSMRQHVNASLPAYYVRIGQAMHTLQDAFTHTYRTADASKVTVALDWLHAANGTLVEAIHGPPHLTELDRCDDPDPLRTRRRELATEASAALLRATLAPGDPERKAARVDEVLETWLGSSAGCHLDNGWCDAPERALAKAAPAGCSSTSALPVGLGLLAALPFFARRRRRRLHRPALHALAVAVLLVGAAARAEEAPVPVNEPGPMPMAFGGSVAGSAAADNQALAVSLGARLRVSKRWVFGADAEWNPWLAITGTAVRAGVLNVYATAIYRIPLTWERLSLRITGNVGVSRLFMDLYGAPQGSTGLYVGLSPLGLEWNLTRNFTLVLNPLNFALPIPHLTGVPLSYPQYRLTLGLEFST